MIISCVDGQKIAKKLSRGIAKEMKKSTTILEELNATCSQLDGHQPYSISEVIIPESDYWSTSVHSSAHKDWSLRRNISQAFLLMKRIEEELGLLREEMRCVINYWRLYKDKISATLSTSNNEDEASRGAQALLRKLLWEVEVNLSRAIDAFSPILSSTGTITSTMDFESDSEESEVESDDEGDHAIDFTC